MFSFPETYNEEDTSPRQTLNVMVHGTIRNDDF